MFLQTAHAILTQSGIVHAHVSEGGGLTPKARGMAHLRTNCEARPAGRQRMARQADLEV
jgi:hypothetical protein